MNITINAGVLAQELRLLNTIVPTKPALPILMNVLIKANGTGLRLVATDLEVAFGSTCRAQIDEDGSVTVPCKRLLDMVEQLSGDIQLVTDRLQVHVRSGSFRSRLQTMTPEDFPALPTAEGKTTALPTAHFQAMVTRVRYAISDKGKYVVNGAYLTLNDTVGALVATDGKRLALTTLGATGTTTTVILPSKTLDAVLTMFTEPTLFFSQSERHLFFQAGDRLLVSRTIDGQFPAYERIIPKQEDGRFAIIDRARLISALRRVGLVSEDNMACYFAFSAGKLDLSSSSALIGDATEQIAVDYNGEPLKVCCNWQFVLDFLEVASRQTVSIAFKDTNTPLLLTDGDNHMAVVMLMRG